MYLLRLLHIRVHQDAMNQVMVRASAMKSYGLMVIEAVVVILHTSIQPTHIHSAWFVIEALVVSYDSSYVLWVMQDVAGMPDRPFHGRPCFQLFVSGWFPAC